MSSQNKIYYQAALEDFQQARRQAAMQQLLARFTGEQTELLSYEDIRQKLKVTNMRERGLHDIPVDKIIGSVGRYKDFTRSFLPISDSGGQRWARVKAAISDLSGLPPIEVYQLGDAYFVIDGNHRVSIARQIESPTISAYVTEVKTRVPLTATDDPNEIICKSRYAEFLEHTNLDKLRPEADLLMTFCAQYSQLLNHIDVHRYYMGLDFQRDVSYEEAVGHWYDEVYMPVVQMIREQGIMRDFPERTEADMYVLLADHRAELENALGWDVDTGTAVSDMKRKKKPGAALARVIEAVVPDELESGPAPGQWRQERLDRRNLDRLFEETLVAISGQPKDWRVLDQAIMMMQRENGRLRGIFVLDSKDEQQDEAAIEAIRAEFQTRTAEAGVQADFSVEQGNVARQIVSRAAYSDLVMMALNCPPGTSILERLTSGVQTILQRTPRPVMVVPTAVSPLQHALLAYDGSPKSEEALFVATYLASRWQIQLTVATISSGSNGKLEAAERILSRARTYLSLAGVSADYLVQVGPTADTLLAMAEKEGADFMIMGGFGRSSMRSLVLGSTLNRVLLVYKQPILICR
ncbi:MAG: universal stress protein [Ardenticatenaceae bacterium]|nr:universal stress protein [Anaerolineales bacterium]MCB9006947.1 universal stress protein [Ardenticatenaceae bacterium]